MVDKFPSHSPRFEARRALEEARRERDLAQQRLDQAKSIGQRADQLKSENHVAEGLRRAYRGKDG